MSEMTSLALTYAGMIGVVTLFELGVWWAFTRKG